MREDFQVLECYPLCSTDQCCGSTGVDAVTYQRLPPISLSNANVSQGCPSVPPAKCKTMSNCQCLPCGENCHFYKCNNLWCNDQCEGCHSQHQQIEVEVDLRKEPLSDPTDDCLTAVNKYRAQAGKVPFPIIAKDHTRTLQSKWQLGMLLMVRTIGSTPKTGLEAAQDSIMYSLLTLRPTRTSLAGMNTLTLGLGMRLLSVGSMRVLMALRLVRQHSIIARMSKGNMATTTR